MAHDKKMHPSTADQTQISDQLNKLLQMPEWPSVAEIARKTGLDADRIGRWHRKELRISFADLVKLAEGTGTTVDWWVGKDEHPFPYPSTRVFQAKGKGDYFTARDSLLRQAIQSIRMQFTIGSSWANNLELLSEILEKDQVKKFSVLMSLTDDPATAMVLARRRELIEERDPEHVKQAVKATMMRFRSLEKQYGTKFEYRYVPFPLPFDLYIIDDQLKSAKAITMLPSFRTTHTSVPIIETTKESDSALFGYFVNYHDSLWRWNWEKEQKEAPELYAVRHPDIQIGSETFDTIKHNIIATAQSEIWFAFRTGATFNWHSGATDALTKAIKGKTRFRIRFMICDPDGPGTRDQIRMRRISPGKRAANVKGAILYTLEELLNFAEKVELQPQSGERRTLIDINDPETYSNLEIVFTRYVPVHISIMVDPETDHGQMLLLEENFHRDFAHAPMKHYRASAPQDRAFYQYYLDEYLRLFEAETRIPPILDADGTENGPVSRRVSDLKALKTHVMSRNV